MPQDYQFSQYAASVCCIANAWSSGRSRALGFSINDTRDLLGLTRGHNLCCAEVKTLAEQHVADIRAKIRDLEKLDRVLSELPARCGGTSVPNCPILGALSQPDPEQANAAMMFIVTGASGSGKSASLPGLRATFPSIDCRDFDEVGVPSSCPREWRPRTTERWLQVALNNDHRGQDTGLLGGAIMGEILACPSAPQTEIRVALLDVQDVVRLDEWGARTERRKRCSRGQPGSGYMPLIPSGGRM